MATAAEKIQAERAERKAVLEAQHQEQIAVDLAAINALEIELGDTNVAAIEFAYVPGLPAMAAVRTPTPDEVGRYRDRMKPRLNRKGDFQPGDGTAAAIELGKATLKYPSPEVFAELLTKRSSLDVALGNAAFKLAAATEEETGKG